ncbi:MAG: GNAT family N-acetyltransferase [Phycisphaeraceae bacterium]
MRVDVDVVADVDTASYRVAQVASTFDVSIAAKSRLTFSAEVPTADAFDWSVGAIVGPSGSGKGRVSRAAYGDDFLESCPERVSMFDWPGGRAVVDGFEAELSTKEIFAMLSAVGFSSPPAWALPCAALSTGRRMRADLARALLLDREVVAFDEFTSTVDRTVAKFASMAVSKAVKGKRCRVKRFVAVTCHRDVLSWLEPDWVLDLGKRPAELARGSLCRPGIDVEVLQCGKGFGRKVWPTFARHHYLSGSLHPAARCYVASVDGALCGFVATLANAGHVGRRIVHRLVVLPDYQGGGLGLKLLEAVCGHEAGQGSVMSICTSHPALIAALGQRPAWRRTNVSKGGLRQGGFSRARGRHTGSTGRVTASYRFVPGLGVRDLETDPPAEADLAG